MTTLLQACKEIVKNSIDNDYLAECGTLREVYLAEYGYNGVNQLACTEYLKGLPSVCTVPFSNYDILELMAKYGLSRKGVNAQDQLITDYWTSCGYAFYQLIK